MLWSVVMMSGSPAPIQEEGQVTRDVAEEPPAKADFQPPQALAPKASAPKAHPTLSAPAAAMVAWCVVGIGDAIAIATLVPVPKGAAGLWLRALHHIYDAGHVIAAGVASAGAVAIWQRFGPRRSLWGYAALALASVGLGMALLLDDLEGFAQPTRDIGIPPVVIKTITAVIVALGVPAAAIFGRLLARRGLLRPLGVGLCLAITGVNHWYLYNDYPSAHLYLAFAAAAVAAASLAGAQLPARLRADKPAAMPRAAYHAIEAALALLGAATLAIPIRNSVLVELLKSSGSAFAPYAAHASAPGRAAIPPIPEAARPWFTDRSGAPPVAPSAPRLLSDDAIIILLSVDALRADVVDGDAHPKELGGIRLLRRLGVNFAAARSPGSQTVYTISTLLMGTYFSQQYWTPRVEPTRAHIWPHEDTSLRFPTLLGGAGVATVTFGAAYWMTDAFGVARGFAEDRPLPTGREYSAAADMVTAAMERLRKHKGGPLFLFMHLLDPHAPYDRGGKTGTPYERYLAEVGVVSEQIRRFHREVRDAGLLARTTWIVTADHGEAFGEHETEYHATTLYEELLRVPLFIVAPGVAPRTVTEPVSLVDLGPTILDLMGQPAPGHFMGQSLVPFLRGERPSLSRPIVAEGRLKRAMVFPDGMKVITDDRRGTIEAYDLRSDPKEERNLYEEGSKVEGHVALLRAFFDAHSIKRPGYKIPYRR